MLQGLFGTVLSPKCTEISTAVIFHGARKQLIRNMTARRIRTISAMRCACKCEQPAKADCDLLAFFYNFYQHVCHCSFPHWGNTHLASDEVRIAQLGKSDQKKTLKKGGEMLRFGK